MWYTWCNHGIESDGWKKFRKQQHVCYVDFKKAIDRINCVNLLAILADNGVDRRNGNLIKEFYINQNAFVMVGEILSETCSIGRGLIQGCSVSLLLFIIYDEAMVREVSHKCAISIRVGGRIVNMIRCADYYGSTLIENLWLQVLKFVKIRETMKL